MAALQSLSCPKCGSSDLAEIGPNRRKCEHCGAESLLSDDRSRLELIGWECPKCGFNNEISVNFCGKCGVSLSKKCQRCLSEVRRDLNFCPKCGARVDDGLVYRYKHSTISIEVLSDRVTITIGETVKDLPLQDIESVVVGNRLEIKAGKDRYRFKIAEEERSKLRDAILSAKEDILRRESP